VASLGREETFHELYMSDLLSANKVALRNTHVRGVVFGLARSIMFFSYSTTMYYGGQLVVEDNIPFETILK
jgi:ATP-binding cassette subfamily B (MDR/TAP) protein 1